jgi:glyoxylase I family protein
MVRGIDHIELVVRDVEQFVKLFESMGFEVILRTPHHGGSAEVKLPGEGQTIFELHSVEGEENPGVNHIAFACEDIHETHKAMVKAGVVFEKAPFKVPATGRVIANFRDPDGWRLQLADMKRSSDVQEDHRAEQGRESDYYRDKPKFT